MGGGEGKGKRDAYTSVLREKKEKRKGSAEALLAGLVGPKKDHVVGGRLAPKGGKKGKKKRGGRGGERRKTRHCHLSQHNKGGGTLTSSRRKKEKEPSIRIWQGGEGEEASSTKTARPVRHKRPREEGTKNSPGRFRPRKEEKNLRSPRTTEKKKTQILHVLKRKEKGGRE